MDFAQKSEDTPDATMDGICAKQHLKPHNGGKKQFDIPATASQDEDELIGLLERFAEEHTQTVNY